MKIKSGRKACLSLLLLTFMHIPLRSKSQNGSKLISISPGIYSYREIFRKIERQANIYFVYSDVVINDTIKTFASSNNLPLETALKLLFQSKCIGFIFRNKAIVLFHHQSLPDYWTREVTGYLWDQHHLFIPLPLCHTLHRSVH